MVRSFHDLVRRLEMLVYETLSMALVAVRFSFLGANLIELIGSTGSLGLDDNFDEPFGGCSEASIHRLPAVSMHDRTSTVGRHLHQYSCRLAVRLPVFLNGGPPGGGDAPSMPTHSPGLEYARRGTPGRLSPRDPPSKIT